jgi:hypothetical protein
MIKLVQEISKEMLVISAQTSSPTRSLLILQPSADFTFSSEAASFKSSDKVKSNLAAEKVDVMVMQRNDISI